MREARGSRKAAPGSERTTSVSTLPGCTLTQRSVVPPPSRRCSSSQNMICASLLCPYALRPTSVDSAMGFENQPGRTAVVATPPVPVGICMGEAGRVHRQCCPHVGKSARCAWDGCEASEPFGGKRPRRSRGIGQWRGRRPRGLEEGATVRRSSGE